MEGNNFKLKKSTVIQVVAGCAVGAILGVMAFYGDWLIF